MRMLDFDTIVTLTTGEPNGSARRVVMVGTLRMAVAALPDLPGHERAMALVSGAGLPDGGIPVPRFGVVHLPEKGRMPRAVSLASLAATVR